MSCSKILSGDLPELIYIVLKYIQNDFTTLHSCILINRLWCRLAIPLLWENPFSIPTKNYNFIYFYLDNLNDELKTKLNEYKIKDNLLFSNTLFNYSKFIKYLNTRDFIYFIGKWFENFIYTLKFKNNYELELNDFKRLIHMSLLKIFIENEVKLHNLCIEIHRLRDYNLYLYDILELILQNPNFLHNIKELKINIRHCSNNSLFKNHTTLVKNCILQLINSQKNLRGISLGYNNLSFYQSSLLSSNCSNTLNTIILYRINFNNINNLKKMFEQLNVLESIHIIYCSSLDTHFIKQIINLTKPFKLKSLFLSDGSQFNEPLLSLLKKFGNYLENFGFSYYDLSLKQQILESMIKYCKNIKFLDLHEFENKINYQIINLIENVKKNLNYLTINLSGNNNEFSSIILQNLGQYLPFKLKYLNLVLCIKVIDLQVFFENSQNIFIEKLLIYNNKMREDNEEILPYIKEHIMKKKRVKYLAFMDTLDDHYFQQKDLFTMEDEVKEFELYNIKVQGYYKSMINVYNFMKKIDY
jgi:hypothetical protein